MRKLFSFNMVTVDGYFEGPNHDINWHHVDSEFNDFAVAQLNEIDTLVFGRVTYQLMAAYWPTPVARENDSMVADLMNHAAKIVVSRTLDKAEWENSRVVKDNIADEIARLKHQPGKDMAVFGSANLLSTLMSLNLVDEHRIMVTPIILGGGTPLFKPEDKIDLRLLSARPFKNGNVLLRYGSDKG